MQLFHFTVIFLAFAVASKLSDREIDEIMCKRTEEWLLTIPKRVESNIVACRAKTSTTEYSSIPYYNDETSKYSRSNENPKRHGKRRHKRRRSLKRAKSDKNLKDINAAETVFIKAAPKKPLKLNLDKSVFEEKKLEKEERLDSFRKLNESSEEEAQEQETPNAPVPIFPKSDDGLADRIRKLLRL